MRNGARGVARALRARPCRFGGLCPDLVIGLHQFERVVIEHTLTGGRPIGASNPVILAGNATAERILSVDSFDHGSFEGQLRNYGHLNHLGVHAHKELVDARPSLLRLDKLLAEGWWVGRILHQHALALPIVYHKIFLVFGQSKRRLIIVDTQPFLLLQKQFWDVLMILYT
jgi:hypothetical protein